MKSTTEVTNEIRRQVADRVDAGISIRVEWFTQEILSQKDQISGDDADFYVSCAAVFIKDTVKRCIGLYEPKTTAPQDRQLVMDGFDYLQKAYTVDRAGERMLVPVQDLTEDEILVRAEELKAIAKGTQKHALELLGYLRAKQAAA